MFTLEGKVAIVTGGASGIGAATCRRFAAAGATCVVADVTDGSTVADEIAGRSVTVDVTDPTAVDALVATTVAEHGRLDIMVNNAGILGPTRGIAADSPEDARAMLDVNVTGVAHGIRAAAAVMDAGAVILNTASMAGLVGFPGLAWYGAGKSAVIGMTRQAAVELGPRGIRVNCVCPTGVDTEGFVPEQAADHWAVRSQELANQHVRRLATPEEIAAALHYLASDDAAMVNGHALPVDGGLAAGPSIQLWEAALDHPIRDAEGISG